MILCWDFQIIFYIIWFNIVFMFHLFDQPMMKLLRSLFDEWFADLPSWLIHKFIHLFLDSSTYVINHLIQQKIILILMYSSTFSLFHQSFLFLHSLVFQIINFTVHLFIHSHIYRFNNLLKITSNILIHLSTDSSIHLFINEHE